MGNKKTSKHHRTLFTTGRFDGKTSTMGRASKHYSDGVGRQTEWRSRITRSLLEEILTKHDNIEDQDNETDDSPTSAIMPRLPMVIMILDRKWGGSSQGK